MGETCDMRGLLSFLILWLLSKGSRSGQEIARELERRKGIKPSPGTIYPALKMLKSRGFVTSKKDGKEVRYALTPRGKKAVNSACSFFVRAFADVFEERK